jgi:hypothetical protein
MKTCPICTEKNDDTQQFCSKCGNIVNKSETPPHAENLQQTSSKETDELKTENEPNANTTTANGSIGKLIFPDKTFFTIDDSQRLVGRADLKMHTNKESNLISRSHFTIYKKNERYFIKDDVTNMQNKASENNTSVNGKSLTSDEQELENNDKILVSDVEMSFEV